MLLYFHLEGINAEQRKTLTAASYFRGEALNWIRPRLTRLLLQKEDTEGMFANFETFCQAMRRIYGLSNDKLVAIRTIQHLTQRTSASQYTAKFKEYSAKTDWDDNALMTMYYRGLKDNVKDELMRVNVDQSSLDNMIQAAIIIDDRLYERAMERRHTGQYRGRSGYVPDSRSGGQQRRDPNAMEIDVTQQRPRKGKTDSRFKGKNQGNKRKEGPECFNCHKIGHYARDCRGNKVRPQQMEVNVMTKKENEPPTDKVRSGDNNSTGQDELEHKKLHWSFCYKDSCQTHLSSKMGSGWFPSKPRKPRKEFNMMSIQPLLQQQRDDGNHARGRSPPSFRWEDATLHENYTPSPTEEIEDIFQEQLIEQEYGILPEIEESDSSGEYITNENISIDEVDETSDEYSEDEEPDHNEILNFSVDGPEPIRMMVEHMARRYEETFPKIHGKRRIHPHEFDHMLTQLRTMFWNYRRVNVDYDASDYVAEKVPIGSTFNPDGSYYDPDGIIINRQMRERVKLVALKYQEIQQIQNKYQEEYIGLSEMMGMLKDQMKHWAILPRMPLGPLPVTWRGTILSHIRTTIKGQVTTAITQGKVTIRPIEGPLNWEICLMDATSPDYYSKNE